MGTRIGLGGISHETNTYLPGTTGLDRFMVLSGDDVLSAEGTRSYLGGMITGARSIDAEPVGLLAALAWPSAPIARDAFDELVDGLLAAVVNALPLDAVALDLHGAGVAEHVPDVEAHLSRLVRNAVGPDVPILATHDLHGNVSRELVQHVDLLLPVHHYPHDDMFERGEELVTSLPRLVAGDWRPTSHLERLPMLVAPTSTYDGVGADVVALCAAAEAEQGVIDCSFFHGFPYTDSLDAGCAVLVTANDDAALARDIAKRVARAIWDQRDRFLVTHPLPDHAVRQAAAMTAHPVVINETSDNPGGGAPADGTHLLRALVEAGVDDAALSAICDPDVVAAAHRAGVGARITVELGGKTDDLHGAPLVGEAYVKVLTDGVTTIEARMGAGFEFTMGRTARLVIGGVDVIVCSQPVQTIDRTPFVLHGIDPRTRKIIALKSSQHFRSGFEDIAGAVVTTDPPGLTTMRLDQLPRKLTARYWPVDPLAGYEG